jgi:pimeloyl-ACP methyl ester carboxylesterase
MLTEIYFILLQSWRAGLTSESAFKSTAWAFVLNGFSEEYLKRNSRYIAHYVEKVYENNNYQNLQVLLSQSHSPQDKAAAINCAHLVTCPTQIIAATADRISDLHQEKRLVHAIRGGSKDSNSNSNDSNNKSNCNEDNDTININSNNNNRNCFFVEMAGAGHLSPFEQPNLWCTHLLSFLDMDLDLDKDDEQHGAR